MAEPVVVTSTVLVAVRTVRPAASVVVRTARPVHWVDIAVAAIVLPHTAEVPSTEVLPRP